MARITREEFWKLYKALPQSLQEVLFSPDTQEAIIHICGLCDIDNDAKVAELVGDVLVGLLPPENFKKEAEEKLNLDQDRAKKLDIYVQHYIFNPVADELRELYHPEEKEIEETPQKPKTKDIYREPIE